MNSFKSRQTDLGEKYFATSSLSPSLGPERLYTGGVPNWHSSDQTNTHSILVIFPQKVYRNLIQIKGDEYFPSRSPKTIKIEGLSGGEWQLLASYQDQCGKLSENSNLFFNPLYASIFRVTFAENCVC